MNNTPNDHSPASPNASASTPISASVHAAASTPAAALEAFFEPARQQQLTDDGFTLRVMQRIAELPCPVATVSPAAATPAVSSATATAATPTVSSATATATSPAVSSATATPSTKSQRPLTPRALWRSRLWTLVCTAAAIALFVAARGWNLLTTALDTCVRTALTDLNLPAIMAATFVIGLLAVSEALSRDRLYYY